MIIYTIESHLTAITRKSPSRPMRYLAQNNKLVGDILDYGCGKGFDCQHYSVDGYDPYFQPEYPKKQYNTIVCNFVLNVVKENEAIQIINNIQDLLQEKDCFNLANIFFKKRVE